MSPRIARLPDYTLLAALFALPVLALLGAGVAGGQVQFLADGATADAAGGWDLPLQGFCPADTAQPTRPDCVARRFNIALASCVGPNYSWATGGVCNDLLHTTQAACEAQPDRKWNAAPVGTDTCAVVLLGDDRNNVSCALHQGTWVTTGTCIGAWLMPNGNAYTPAILTANPGTPAGPGDQCLRCHNGRTQYNGPRVRDTENTIYTGHKNMARKVTAGTVWGGPPFACAGYPAATSAAECLDHLGFWNPEVYPGTDRGQDFDWANGTVDIGPLGSPNPRNLYWIYADWLSAFPRAIYHDAANTATTPDSPQVSYSCARCHTTGWSADTTLQVDKEPHRSFLAEAPAGSNQAVGGSGIPSIVWDGVSDAVDGQVNLAPGGPFNTTMASWDLWGVSCARCHGSAVDLATHGGVPPLTAPAGMSTHNSGMTSPDTGSGYCSNPQWTTVATCNASAVSAAWLTACSVAGVCSNAADTTSGACVAHLATWTAYSAQAACLAAGADWRGTGCIGDATRTTQAACETAGRSWYGNRCSIPTYTSQTSCENAGAVWSNDQCSLGGVCNDPLFSDALACRAAGAYWAAATDAVRCADARGRWSGTKANRGQVITGLCMSCHRQESAGLPSDASHPATALQVGPNQGTVSFLSHPHANQFLNSPHGLFTGTFDQIPTGSFDSTLTGEYKSLFMRAGEAANAGNGCTGCHDVHTSTAAGEKPFRAGCTECHAKDLRRMNHSGGAGTPFENMATDPMAACVICHMPAGEHLFRINVESAYSTKPVAALTANANANTAADGNYANAVWSDLDSACGQCHGGGVANVVTTGSIAGGTKLLTVAPGQGAQFTVGQRLEVAGAGTWYYDDLGTSRANDDFESYVVAIAGDVLTLAGNAAGSVTHAAVEQNPVKNYAAYFTKANLAEKARGIHNDKPYVSFGYSLNPANTLQVNVDASASACSGSLARCDAFVWSWGDLTPDTTTGVPTASHIYAAAGTYAITLTVQEYGVSEGSTTKNVRVFAIDAPPVAGGTACASIVNPNTWVASLVDNSTDDNGVRQVTVSWGDGGALSSAIDPTPPYSLIGTVFPHTYLNAGSYTIRQTAYDTAGQANVRTCPAVTLTTFTLSGNARRLNNTAVANATVTVKLAGVTVRTVFTNSLGNYTVANLKPGTYTITATRTGLTFPQVYNQLVGPSASGLNFQSIQ